MLILTSLLLAAWSSLVQRRLICLDAQGSFRRYLSVYLTMMVLPSFHCVWPLGCCNCAVCKMYCEIETWEVWENFLKLFAKRGWLSESCWHCRGGGPTTTTGCWECLDLRETKCQEAGKSCIMRNIMIFTLNSQSCTHQMTWDEMSGCMCRSWERRWRHIGFGCKACRKELGLDGRVILTFRHRASCI